MNLGVATLVIGGAIGLGLSIFGVMLLVTGRAPARTTRTFRTVRAAALYHLLFGSALLLMVVGQTLLTGNAGSAVAAAAIALVGLALVRYRPRRRRSVEDGSQ